jgi:O-antigen/teichoic acid export membrane protein
MVEAPTGFQAKPDGGEWGMKAVIAKSGLAFLDQAVLSGTNFVVAIILMKTAGKEQYGYYSIAFAMSLFLVSLQNAVVTTPLAVLLAGKEGEAKDVYAGALYWGQIIAVVPVSLLGLAVTGILHFSGLGTTQISTISALCFAGIGILLREFSRAYHFARQSTSTVLLLDLTFAAGYFVLLGVCYPAGITAPVAFVLMGVSSILSSVVFKEARWKCDWAAIRESYQENWAFAKWSLTGVMVSHLQSYCNLYLTGTLIGTAAAGSLSASRLPMSPLALLQTGWNKVAVPRGAHLRERRQLRQFFKEQVFATVVVGIGVVAYVGVLWMLADVLKRLLFNKGYEGSLELIWFWAAINIVGFTALSASIGLQVIKEFGTIVKNSSVTMLITLASTVILIGRYGIQGGLAASLLGDSVLAASLWWCLAKRYFMEVPL